MSTYSDLARTTKYQAPPGCVRPTLPQVKFDTSELKLSDLERAVSKKRNKNAPGINGILFLVYKKCPRILSALHVQVLRGPLCYCAGE